MVFSPETIHCLKSSLRLSSVVPATVTDQKHKVHELTNMDLAVKLHYIKGVYFFKSDAVQGLTAHDLKKPMFQLLQLYFAVSGRIRRSGTGRPFIKCNDSGVRTVEASCDETVDEWLARAVKDDSVFDGLAYNQALGDPDLGFSPLVFIQFTWFKCGGMSVGLSWANVLGDAFSASNFINLWGKALAGQMQQKSLQIPDSAKDEFQVSELPKLTPSAVKRVDLVGDLWLTPNISKMKTHTFYVHVEKINRFLSDKKSKVSAFEVISAIIWKFLSKIKENAEETRMVTLCTNKSGERKFEFLSNEMVWSTVEADFWVAEAEVSELVELIMNKREDENGMIEKIMGNIETGDKSVDFISYGANLTFVNLEEMEIYGLELKEQKPVYAHYSINGVGDEGVVLVLPAGPKSEGGDDVDGDRTVTVILPENQLAQLKVELERNWSIA
ncbi:protein ECERIFERUM 26-like [Argentina anserina]|uniref:protein ECERIFERUM 26-like n=1 Tax=Argentina anserina TaxID=57926 RepID=UPI00217643DB|nr:protein ECERIFERUM 26-like [Potentilla anserina]